MSSAITRALLSVSDKTGIVEFAKQLQILGIAILSTGGTAQLLQKNNIACIEVADYTGFPEMLGGRIKTLHPKIHGGLLARRGIDDETVKAHDIPFIDLVVVNLYPFAQTIAEPNCDLAKAIENIDIGGPTMLRSAAKNYTAVTVLVDPNDYDNVITEIKTQKNTTLATRFNLAKKVFAHTANYDGIITNYLTRTELDSQQQEFPAIFNAQLIKKETMRYGENPHQKAAFYVEANPKEASIATAVQHQGKPLSYNNVADSDAALECVKSFADKPACVIVKHANPCGVAVANHQLQAYEAAFATDPTSAFGGIIAFNQTLTVETAEKILANQFVEVIIAPEVKADALALLQQKPNIRVLSTGHWQTLLPTWDYKRVNGGLLIQERDIASIHANDLKIVTQRAPTAQELSDLLFAWQVVKHVKSNAIVYAKNNATIGIGAGQMSRVFSVMIAGMKAADAKLSTQGVVMASDAFFPFRDGVDLAVKAGISAIIQPGGSIKDEEVIKAANEANLAMVFTGVRHFKH